MATASSSWVAGWCPPCCEGIMVLFGAGPAALRRNARYVQLLQEGSVFTKRTGGFLGITTKTEHVHVRVCTERNHPVGPRLEWWTKSMTASSSSSSSSSSAGKGASAVPPDSTINVIALRAIDRVQRKSDQLTVVVHYRANREMLSLELIAATSAARDEWADALEDMLDEFRDGDTEEQQKARQEREERDKNEENSFTSGFTNRVEKQTYFMQREVELQEKKKAAAERKARMLNGGGLNYVAKAMAERASRDDR